MDSTPTIALAPKSVDAGRGVSWWGDGWRIFMKNPLLWVVLGLINIVIFMVLAFIPFLGGIAAALLAPVFIAGWMQAARKVESGGTLEVGDLFSPFQSAALSPLVILGALLLGASIVVGVVAFLLGAGAFMGMVMGGGHTSNAGVMAAMGTGIVAMLLFFVLGFMLAMAFWFAPGLVLLRGTPPVDALKASFSASLKNIGPFLLYGILYFVAAIVASIPFGLGWFVLVPVLMLTIYVSYQDVFEL
jgi:uncharacterized membrane protein